jgi:hypothetical protein
MPVPDGAPVYLGDDERVRQILVNLLSNAVKFTSTGGRITLEVGRTASPDSSARVHPNREYVSFCISDTGSGIAEDKLLAIFDPFVQVDSGHSRAREGSGLGLTISRRLARLMGGDLTVSTKIGEGSSFTLWLPADESPAVAEAHPAIAGEHVAVQRDVKDLSKVGRVLLDGMEATTARIVDRIRTDPNLNVAAGLKFSQVADHFPALLADVAGSLIVLEELRGQASPLLADATEIQRLVSERHGVQRHRLGWNEAALRREFMIVREELEHIVRDASTGHDPLPVEDAVLVIGRFMDQSEYVAVKALNAARKV